MDNSLFHETAEYLYLDAPEGKLSKGDQKVFADYETRLDQLADEAGRKITLQISKLLRQLLDRTGRAVSFHTCNGHDWLNLDFSDEPTQESRNLGKLVSGVALDNKLSRFVRGYRKEQAELEKDKQVVADSLELVRIFKLVYEADKNRLPIDSNIEPELPAGQLLVVAHITDPKDKNAPIESAGTIGRKGSLYPRLMPYYLAGNNQVTPDPRYARVFQGQTSDRKRSNFLRKMRGTIASIRARMEFQHRDWPAGLWKTFLVSTAQQPQLLKMHQQLQKAIRKAITTWPKEGKNIEWYKIPADALVILQKRGSNEYWTANGKMVFWSGQTSREAQEFLTNRSRYTVPPLL